MIEFAIYRLPVGKGQLALSPMPGRTRHYHADWQHLMAWQPDLVLTMTTQAELDRKGAGTLGSDLTNAGIAWLPLPVAGCGRAGMMVLRLMIAAGEEANTALVRLRAARPCAVETDDQMRWAFQG